MKFQIDDALPTPTEYCELRKICGLSPKTEHAATLGLPRSLYSVTIRADGRLIGMGRVIGDLGCHVQITDIAIHPDFQKQGLSNEIMTKIMGFVKKEVPDCCFVNLFADVDYLYKKFGFIDSLKSKGMYLDWKQFKALMVVFLLVLSFQSEAKCPIQLVQGKSFGDLELGMTRDQVEALGYKHAPSETKLINQDVGLYTLQYNQQGQVIDISAELKKLPDCVYSGKKKVSKSASAKELSKIFTRCGPEDIRKGGNLTKCESVWILYGAWGATIRNHQPTYGVAQPFQ